METVFNNVDDAIYMDFLVLDTTVNRECYITTFKLRKKIEAKFKITRRTFCCSKTVSMISLKPLKMKLQS